MEYRTLSRNNSVSSTTTSNMEEEDNDTLSLSSSNIMSDSGYSGSSQNQNHHNQQNHSQQIQNSRTPNIMSLVHHKWRKMWKRDSADITPNDPSYKAVYLGNVVTTWAKGDGCLERPASALWKNHCQGRGSIKMVISVAPSGLKAQTREHGLTEYWANRLTWCGVPPDYPKLFCWIYRHEGRKLKQELRCHAVLCTKEDRAIRLACSLRNRLTEALFDFKKEKILRQNARLSIVQSLYNNSAPKRRMILLNSNSQNYKPPMERSKSAPKLSCIEEFEEDENEENFNMTNSTIPESELEHVPVTMSPLEVLVNNSSVLQSNPVIKTNGTTTLIVSEVEERSESPITNSESPKRGSPDLNSSRRIESPISHRKSYAHPLTHHTQEGTRRPHTVPMDAKLNLPYMTGYDKVMQLLDMPTGDTHHLLLDDEDDEFSYPFDGPNSDPVASSPGSDASESVVDSSGCEDEYGKITRNRRRGSCDRKAVEECSPEDREDEMNDNVSDESGYSEEATVIRRNSSSETDLSLNLDPSGSPPILKRMSSTNNNTCKSTIIIRGNEPVIIDSLSSNPKTTTTTKTTFRSDENGGPPTTCTTSTTTLVVYDNLCFEI